MGNFKRGVLTMAFSEKRAAYNYINGYTKEKYDRITIIRKKGDKEKLKTIAASRNMSVNEFINSCIDEKLKRAGIDLNKIEIE